MIISIKLLFKTLNSNFGNIQISTAAIILQNHTNLDCNKPITIVHHKIIAQTNQTFTFLLNFGKYFLENFQFSIYLFCIVCLWATSDEEICSKTSLDGYVLKTAFNEFLTFGNTEFWQILMNFSSNLIFFAQLALHIALQTHVQLTQSLT